MTNDIALLTKNEREELKRLIKLANKDQFHKIKMENKDVKSWNYYQKRLLKFELIKKTFYEENPNPSGWDTKNSGPAIQITEDGYHYFEKYHDHLKNSILNSFITPIVVSVVTTLITIGVQQLLRLILK